MQNLLFDVTYHMCSCGCPQYSQGVLENKVHFTLHTEKNRKVGSWAAILAPIARTPADFLHENRIQSVNKHARFVE